MLGLLPHARCRLMVMGYLAMITTYGSCAHACVCSVGNSAEKRFLGRSTHVICCAVQVHERQERQAV